MAVVNSMYEDASDCSANLDDWSDTSKCLPEVIEEMSIQRVNIHQ
jgi:hypothetical protein